MKDFTDLIFGYIFVGIALLLLGAASAIFIGWGNAKIIIGFVSAIFTGIVGLFLLFVGVLLLKDFIVDAYEEIKEEKKDREG